MAARRDVREACARTGERGKGGGVFPFFSFSRRRGPASARKFRLRFWFRAFSARAQRAFSIESRSLLPRHGDVRRERAPRGRAGKRSRSSFCFILFSLPRAKRSKSSNAHLSLLLQSSRPKNSLRATQDLPDSSRATCDAPELARERKKSVRRGAGRACAGEEPGLEPDRAATLFLLERESKKAKRARESKREREQERAIKVSTLFPLSPPPSFL